MLQRDWLSKVISGTELMTSIGEKTSSSFYVIKTSWWTCSASFFLIKHVAGIWFVNAVPFHFSNNLPFASIHNCDSFVHMLQLFFQIFRRGWGYDRSTSIRSTSNDTYGCNYDTSFIGKESENSSFISTDNFEIFLVCREFCLVSTIMLVAVW